MSKPKRATLKQLPTASEITYRFSEIEAIYEDTPDRSGRLSPFSEHIGKTIVIIVLK